MLPQAGSFAQFSTAARFALAIPIAAQGHQGTALPECRFGLCVDARPNRPATRQGVPDRSVSLRNSAGNGQSHRQTFGGLPPQPADLPLRESLEFNAGIVLHYENTWHIKRTNPSRASRSHPRQREKATTATYGDVNHNTKTILKSWNAESRQPNMMFIVDRRTTTVTSKQHSE